MKECKRCYNCMFWEDNGHMNDNICGNIKSKRYLDPTDGRDYCEEWENDYDCED